MKNARSEMLQGPKIGEGKGKPKKYDARFSIWTMKTGTEQLTKDAKGWTSVHDSEGTKHHFNHESAATTCITVTNKEIWLYESPHSLTFASLIHTIHGVKAQDPSALIPGTSVTKPGTSPKKRPKAVTKSPSPGNGGPGLTLVQKKGFIQGNSNDSQDAGMRIQWEPSGSKQSTGYKINKSKEGGMRKMTMEEYVRGKGGRAERGETFKFKRKGKSNTGHKSDNTIVKHAGVHTYYSGIKERPDLVQLCLRAYYNSDLRSNETGSIWVSAVTKTVTINYTPKEGTFTITGPMDIREPIIWQIKRWVQGNRKLLGGGGEETSIYPKMLSQ